MDSHPLGKRQINLCHYSSCWGPTFTSYFKMRRWEAYYFCKYTADCITCPAVTVSNNFSSGNDLWLSKTILLILFIYIFFGHAIHKLIWVFILLNLFKNIYACWKSDTLCLFCLESSFIYESWGTLQVYHILRTTSEISTVWIVRLWAYNTYILYIQHYTNFTCVCVRHMLAVWFIGITC
jgi:hypothetical protein